jgi:predicted dehydrogenase
VTGPVRVGIVGAGNVSDEYLCNLARFPDVEIVGIADLDVDRAAAQADAYGIAHAGSTASLVEREEVELVVNLTTPAGHADVALAAIAAGKHVWGEKPFTLDRKSAQEVLDAAAAQGVQLGNAPDTILGEGVQHAHRLLVDGAIGAPRTVLTLMQGPGPDSWHPRPQFLFAKGAGPLFDIGPYYVTTLVQLLGGIESVQALGQTPRTERVIGSGPDAGTVFPVEVPTHVSVLTRFRSGVIGTSIYSFDSAARRQLFEVTGATGTLDVPVSGAEHPTRVLRGDERTAAWAEYAPTGAARGRGVGVVEMARALRAGQPPRAGGALARHVLDVLLAIEESAGTGEPIAVASTAPPVAPLPADWDPTAVTL